MDRELIYELARKNGATSKEATRFCDIVADEVAVALKEAGNNWDTQVLHSASTIKTALNRMAEDVLKTKE